MGWWVGGSVSGRVGWLVRGWALSCLWVVALLFFYCFCPLQKAKGLRVDAGIVLEGLRMDTGIVLQGLRMDASI